MWSSRQLLSTAALGFAGLLWATALDGGLAVATSSEDDSVQHRGNGAIPVRPEEADVGSSKRVLEHVGHLNAEEDTERFEQTVSEESKGHQDGETEGVTVGVVGELVHADGQLSRRNHVEGKEQNSALNDDLWHSPEVLPAWVASKALLFCALSNLLLFHWESPQMAEETSWVP